MTTQYFIVTNDNDGAEYLFAGDAFTATDAARIADSMGGNVFTYDSLKDAKEHDKWTRTFPVYTSEQAQRIARCCSR